MKKRIRLLLLLFITIFLCNITFAGGPEYKTTRHWMIYVGGFGGYGNVTFQWKGTYVNNTNRFSPFPFEDDLTQDDGIVGGQVGIQYHFYSPVFIGVDFSGVANYGKATSATTVDDFLSVSGQTFEISQQFEMDYNLDTTIILGGDVTPSTHAYLKAGVSNAKFKRNLSTPPGSFTDNENRTITGWVIGFGVSHDLGKWVSIFGEINYRDYGNRDLRTLYNIAPLIGATQTDSLFQNTDIFAYSFRLGLNINFWI